MNDELKAAIERIRGRQQMLGAMTFPTTPVSQESYRDLISDALLVSQFLTANAGKLLPKPKRRFRFRWPWAMEAVH